MRTSIALVFGAVWSFAPLAAQQPDTAPPRRDALCYRPRPRPACSAFILTNAAGYVFIGGPVSPGTPVRGVLDWGLMRNVSEREALGGSVLISLDEDGFVVGPAVRYRRWTSQVASIEFGLAAPLVVIPAWSDNVVQRGSIFGLLKWNPNHWLGLAVRPELVRHRVATSCAPGPIIQCMYEDRHRMRMSIGVELGWTPGVVATGLSMVAAPLLHYLVSSVD